MPERAELYPYAPPDVVESVITWLQPLGRTSTERRPGDPLPFRTVRLIQSTGDGFIERSLVAVHTIAPTEAWAAAEGARTQRRLAALAPPYGAPQPVQITSGTVTFDSIESGDQDVVRWADDGTEWASVGVYTVRACRPMHNHPGPCIRVHNHAYQRMGANPQVRGLPQGWRCITAGQRHERFTA